MKNIIFNVCVFVIIVVSAMLFAVYDVDIEKASLLVIAFIIIFCYFYNKIFYTKPKELKVNGKMTSEQIQELLAQQEDEEWPKLLLPFARATRNIERWGIKHKLYSLDELVWGLVVMLVTALAFFVLVLMDPILSENVVGPVGAFIMIGFGTGFYMFIKAFVSNLADYFFN